MEVTGKNQDECIVALHDCNGDVNKAINILLEGNSDTVRLLSIIRWFAVLSFVSNPILHLNFTLYGGGDGENYECHSIFVLSSRKNTNLKWLFLLYMVSSWSCRIWRLEKELGHLLQPYTVSKILWACGYFHHLKKLLLAPLLMFLHLSHHLLLLLISLD